MDPRTPILLEVVRRRPLAPAMGLGISLLVLVLLGAVWVAEPAEGGRVAILLSAPVDVYSEAASGVRQVLAHEVVGEYDMRGDFDRGQRMIAEIETKLKPDLVLAVGVWALQLAVREQTSMPVVYTMVLNPPSVLGEKTYEFTGASMNVPVERAIWLLEQLQPRVERVGALFDANHTGYLVDRAQALAQGQGLKLVFREVHSSGEAVSALDSLGKEGIQALWILPDETVLAPAVVEHLLLFSFSRNIAVLGLSGHAQMGALAALSFGSSEDIGRQAAELANHVLAGAAPSSIPYTTARKVSLTLNLKTARKLGIEVPQSVIAAASEVIQ